jgi:hypothetical protein
MTESAPAQAPSRGVTSSDLACPTCVCVLPVPKQELLCAVLSPAGTEGPEGDQLKYLTLEALDLAYPTGAEVITD